ncbi:MAG: hypothetical protein COA67_06540 [Lutibacter sp.]|nr:MAG: hypothetical protein COA67_06540 [Lutibacter sp.]
MCTTVTFGQEKEPEEFKSMYLVVTTLHWSSDADADFSDWKKTEQEYFDKVTSKNDLIAGSGYYTHYFTPDNSELVLVSLYKSWEDIEKADEVTDKLIDAGWPDEDARTAFFEKQGSYYSAKHSDEIYTTYPFTKEVNTESTEPLLFYVRKNIASGLGGKGYKEFFENIVMKNKYIKGFYTHGHRWGADARDRFEVGVYDSLGDIERAFDENERLVKAHWPDEEKRKAFFKEYNKIFSGHGDYIYTSVPSLSK